MNWAYINHPKPTNDVTYTFPTERICDWCKQPRPRAAGRWVTKTVWVCHTCKKDRVGYDND